MGNKLSELISKVNSVKINKYADSVEIANTVKDEIKRGWLETFVYTDIGGDRVNFKTDVTQKNSEDSKTVVVTKVDNQLYVIDATKERYKVWAYDAYKKHIQAINRGNGEFVVNSLKYAG
jgi:hypothetical protein